MDKLQAFAAWLHTAALYPVAGVPLWIISMVVSFPVIDQLVKRAGWTTARSFVELAARFLLKSPFFGPFLALIPLLGDILHAVANDTNVPPTLMMRVKAALPSKKDPPSAPPADKPPGASGTVPAVLVLFFFGVTTLASCAFCSKAANKDTAQCKAQAVATDCAAPEVIAIVADIAVQVSAALASNDYTNLLNNIEADIVKRGRTDGPGVLTCALLDVTSRPTAAKDTATNTASTRAKAYMTAHPAKVKNAKAVAK